MVGILGRLGYAIYERQRLYKVIELAIADDLIARSLPLTGAQPLCDLLIGQK